MSRTVWNVLSLCPQNTLAFFCARNQFGRSWIKGGIPVRTYVGGMLEGYGVTQSMWRKGNCQDNAVMENFFGLLKSELLCLWGFESVDEFDREPRLYIEYCKREEDKEGARMDEAGAVPAGDVSERDPSGGTAAGINRLRRLRGAGPGGSAWGRPPGARCQGHGDSSLPVRHKFVYLNRSSLWVNRSP